MVQNAGNAVGAHHSSRALLQGSDPQQMHEDDRSISAGGGVAVIGILGGGLAVTLALGLAWVCFCSRFSRRRRQVAAAADPESARADGEDDAEEVDGGGKEPMDRARSAYIVEGPDGEFACGVRISSFVVPRKSVSLELPKLKLPDGGKPVASHISDIASADGESSGNSSGELALSLQTAQSSDWEAGGSCSGDDGASDSAGRAGTGNVGGFQGQHGATADVARHGAAGSAAVTGAAPALRTGLAAGTSGGAADTSGDAADAATAPSEIVSAALQAADSDIQPAASQGAAAAPQATDAAVQAVAGVRATAQQTPDVENQAVGGASANARDADAAAPQDAAAAAPRNQTVEHLARLLKRPAQPPAAEGHANRQLSLRQRFSFSSPSHSPAASPTASRAASGTM